MKKECSRIKRVDQCSETDAKPSVSRDPSGLELRWQIDRLLTHWILNLYLPKAKAEVCCVFPSVNYNWERNKIGDPARIINWLCHNFLSVKFPSLSVITAVWLDTEFDCEHELKYTYIHTHTLTSTVCWKLTEFEWKTDWLWITSHC